MKPLPIINWPALQSRLSRWLPHVLSSLLPPSLYRSLYRSLPRLLPWVLPWVAPLGATVLAWWLSPPMPQANLSMVYLAGVLLTAFTTRVRPALACALISFLAYNFFFTEPHFTLFVVKREDVLTLSLFLLVAVVTGHLAASLREQLSSLAESHRWNLQQIELARDLTRNVSGLDVLGTVAGYLSSALDMPCHAYLRHAGDTQVQALTNGGKAFLHDVIPFFQVPPGPHAGSLIETASGLVASFGTDEKVSGVILIAPVIGLNAWQKSHLQAQVHLGALAWERTLVAARLHQETIEKERELLRSTLLSSVSHDLRTPLATMIGSVSSVIELRDSLSEHEQTELLTQTLSEAQRLNRYIQKLLDMTKLGYGDLKLDRDWIGIDDILSSVVKRIQPIRRDIALVFDLPGDLPLLHVHPALIEQAIFNVVENSVRLAPLNSRITIACRHSGKEMIIDIQDEGPGIEPQHWKRIFDMFYSLGHGDHDEHGVGLGLAICQGIAGAHGGLARVLRSSASEGTVIRLVLPLNPQQHDQAAA